MEFGFVVMWGAYIYSEMNEDKTHPIFTYNWNEARVYEDYNDAEKMRHWLSMWDSKQSIRMKDWTFIDSSFRIVKIKPRKEMTNIRKAKKHE